MTIKTHTSEYNKSDIDTTELFNLFTSISKFFHKNVNLYALGGTALTLLNIKTSTIDIDINIDKESEYRYVCKIFSNIGFKRESSIRYRTQEGLAFDIFHGSNIMGTNLLEDCLEKSKIIKKFGNLTLHTLSLEDIIISKLARGDPRDMDDIKSIFDDTKIELRSLVDRYKKTMESSTVGKHKQKLLDLVHFKFKEWNFKLDDELITEVEQWQE